MSALDWFVLIATLGFIGGYGAWKTHRSRDVDDYLRSAGTARWWSIGISVMATQASAITFLSTPGQAYADGMGFVQFYFGLPIALVVICVFIAPRYYSLNVYTAYQYLEQRFDRRTRQLAALLFLVQRGLAAGITIFAPAIILSSTLGWNLEATNVFVGLLVIVYTALGGSKAVSQTQMHQMAVIFVGMLFAFGYLLWELAPYVHFVEALRVAKDLGKMTIVDFSLDPSSRYTVWSGLTGGFFLALSYFGTDQSQVQRYLTGRSVDESRLGLLFNALLKIPMQFLILLTGVLVFVLYQFEPAPIFFNAPALASARAADEGAELRALEDRYRALHREAREELEALVHARRDGSAPSSEALRSYYRQQTALREAAKAEIARLTPEAELKDADYVFLSFILSYLPHGLIGLLLAAILCAAMSSTSSEINALASTTVIDFYQRSIDPSASQERLVLVTKILTVVWGAVAIGFALVASLFENLIQAVNIVGSLFYGTILAIFLAAFFFKRINARGIFYAAVLGELLVAVMYVSLDIGFLWFNAIGCAVTLLFALLLSARGIKQ